MTAEEYRALPETSFKTELIDGAYITYERANTMRPAPKDSHEEIVALTFALLVEIVPARELRVSKTDVYLSDTMVVQPDVLWASKDSG